MHEIPRIYSPEAAVGKQISLTQDQQRHLKVIKLATNSKIRLFDGNGREFEGVYEGKVRAWQVHVELEISPQKEPQIPITLAIATPKGARMDFLVEKVSELGVAEIIPINCARSIVNPRDTKIDRLQRIAIAACEQSKRAKVPKIHTQTTFDLLLQQAQKYQLAFICHKTGKPLPFAIKSETLIIVGPEGDFTPEELEKAQKVGCTTISLGPTTLRTETAGIAAVAQIISKTLEKSE